MRTSVLCRISALTVVVAAVAVALAIGSMRREGTASAPKRGGPTKPPKTVSLQMALRNELRRHSAVLARPSEFAVLPKLGPSSSDPRREASVEDQAFGLITAPPQSHQDPPSSPDGRIGIAKADGSTTSPTVIDPLLVTTPHTVLSVTLKRVGDLEKQGVMLSTVSPTSFIYLIQSPGIHFFTITMSTDDPSNPGATFTVDSPALEIIGLPVAYVPSGTTCIVPGAPIAVLGLYGDSTVFSFSYPDLPPPSWSTDASIGSFSASPANEPSFTASVPGGDASVSITLTPHFYSIAGVDVTTTLFAPGFATIGFMVLPYANMTGVAISPGDGHIDPATTNMYTATAIIAGGAPQPISVTWALTSTSVISDPPTGPTLLPQNAAPFDAVIAASIGESTTFVAPPTTVHLQFALYALPCLEPTEGVASAFGSHVTIDVAYDISDFSVSPAASLIKAGSTVQFTVTGDTGQSLPIDSWALSGAGSISATGLYTAPSSPGSAIMTVGVARLSDPLGIYPGGNSYTKQFALTVVAAGVARLPVTNGDFNINEVSNELVCLTDLGACACQSPVVGNQTPAPGGDVFVHNGEEHLVLSDLFVRGRGEIDFQLIREYRSRILFDGPIGQGWDFNYNEHLVFQSNGDTIHVNGFGRADTYKKNVDGSFSPPKEFFRALIVDTDGSYVIRERTGFKHRFDATSGNLIALEDRNQNRMTFSYNAQAQLVQALDPYGRAYTFSWTSDGRLASVSDFAGRTVTYGYNAARDLITVTTPAVTGTSTGNDFPQGRTSTFAYSSGFADEDLNHNLLTFTDSGETVPTLTITYGTDPSSPLTYDKVTSVLKGGTNDSGVPAGGTWAFLYETVADPIAAGLPATVVRKTTVTDPVGNVTVYAFDSRARMNLTRQVTHGVRPTDPASFDTVKTYNDDSLVLSATMPLGNRVDYVYDSANPSRFSQCNLLQVTATPDATRGGGDPLVARMTYEPLFNGIASMTDARELSTSYVPAIGANAPGRYTTKFFYDYQEGSGSIPEAVKYGIDLSSVARGLGDLNGDGRTDQVAGNVVLVRAPQVNLLPGSNEALGRGTTIEKIETQLMWNDVGQPLSTVDPEGNLHTASYYPENDPDGGTATVPGNTSTLPRGYMKTTVRDAGATPSRREAASPSSITTTLSYDPLGRVTLVLNPRGISSGFEWNALGELVSVVRAKDTTVARANGQLLLDNQAFAYVTRQFYDAEGRVTKIQTENRDTNTPELGQYIERTFTYDLLDEVVAATAKVDATTTLTTTFRYTPDQRLTLVTKPAGNQTQITYDERNLTYQVTRGYGSTGAAPSTVTFNYDLNGGVSEILDPEHLRSGGTAARTTYTRDGFDRVTTVTDPIGGKLAITYDPVSAVVKRQFYGHPANQPSSAITLLAESRLSRDELSRVFQVDRPLFLASGFTTQRPVNLTNVGSLSSGAGLVTTRVEYDALSRMTFMIDADRQTSSRVYDGASRPIISTDPLGNVSTVDYDQNSNPIRARSTEISPEGLVPSETFTTLYVWDSLDRLARVTDNAGQTATLTYDSRNNVIDTADAVGPLVNDPLGLYTAGQINSTGNTTASYFDGLNRLTKKVMDLRVGGQGGNPLDLSNPASPTGQITQKFTWDGNSRLSSLQDDKGNTTLNIFDELDRPTKEVAADLSFRFTTYDRDDNPLTSTDANGTVVTRTFDNLNRLVSASIAQSTHWNVGGTTAQSFNYDGASRLTNALDTTAAGVTCEVDYSYDSLSRPLEEIQDGNVVSNVWAGDGRRLSLGYASGTVLNFDHDANKRLKDIIDTGTSSTVSHWDWIGPGMRPLRRAVENGVTLSFLDDAGHTDLGWDSVQRVSRMRYLNSQGGAIADLAYTYDRANNRTSEVRNHDATSDLYAYDSVYRVVSAQYNLKNGVPQGVLGDLTEAFTFDGVGNRTGRTQTVPTTNMGELGAVNVTSGSGSTSSVANFTFSLSGKGIVNGNDASSIPAGYGTPGTSQTLGLALSGNQASSNVQLWGGGNPTQANLAGGSPSTPAPFAVTGGGPCTYSASTQQPSGSHWSFPSGASAGTASSQAVQEIFTQVEAFAAPYESGSVAAPGPHNNVILINGTSQTDFQNLKIASTLSSPTNPYLLIVRPGAAKLANTVLTSSNTPFYGIVYVDLRDYTGNSHSETASVGNTSLGTVTAQVMPNDIFKPTNSGGSIYGLYLVDGPQGASDWSSCSGLINASNAGGVVGTVALNQNGPIVNPANSHYVDTNNHQQTLSVLQLGSLTLGSSVNILQWSSTIVTATLGKFGLALTSPPETVTTGYTTNSVNEYTAIGTVQPGHDPNGNLTDDGTFTYQYDFRNLLVLMTNKSSGATAAYRYDALGRRIEKKFGTETRRHVYDGARVLEEHDQNGPKNEWVYGVGLDEPVRLRSRGASYYFAQNAIGSVVAITDHLGNVVERYKYAAFGKDEVENPDGTPSSGSVVGNAYRFQGRWRDYEEGSPLVYFRARYYDPETGRFTSRDPMGTWADQMQIGNSYGFCGNNGVTCCDSMGLGAPESIKILANAKEKPGYDIDINRDDLTIREWQVLNNDNPERLTAFYDQWLGKFADKIKTEAASNGIPPWLLTAVILGESIDVSNGLSVTFFGRPIEIWREKDIESVITDQEATRFGKALSVGLAQIPVDVALKYDLTPTSAKAKAETDPTLKAIDRETVRRELMDNNLAIAASAKYLAILVKQAKSKCRCCGESHTSTDLGKFDWAAFDKTGDWMALGRSVSGANSTDIEARVAVAKFFGAAHNDDSVTGPFTQGSGLGQGQNAGFVMDHLQREQMGNLFDKYKLK